MKHNDSQKGSQYKKLNAYGGCGYYRIMKVAEQLKPEHDVTVWGTEWQDKFEEFDKDEEMFYTWIATTFDVVWIHFIDNPRVFAYLYAAMNKHSKKIVMDIDDNYLDVDSTNPAAKIVGRGTGKRAELSTILSFCDALTVSTVPLKEKLQAHFKEVHNVDVPIFVIPNYNDIKDWNFTPIEKPDGLVIGYMGGISHHGDLDMVLPAIKEVMTKYDHVGFQLIGQLNHDAAKKVFKGWSQKLRKRILLVQPSATFLDFPWWMSQQPWDIGIAPLTKSKFNECKSHIKFMEYSMYQIPTVASRVYPYYMDVLGIPTITDTETGVLAENGQWVEKLSKLIEDKEYRELLGKNAYIHVKDNWQYKDAKARILEVANEISSL